MLILTRPAIGAIESAMRQNDMIGGCQPFGDHPQLACAAMDPFPQAAQTMGTRFHRKFFHYSIFRLTCRAAEARGQ